MILHFLALISALLVGHPVVVHCNNKTPADLKGVPWVGWAYVGKRDLTLRPEFCRRAYKGDKLALHVLAHELGHTLGRKTEVGADDYADKNIDKLISIWHKQK